MVNEQNETILLVPILNIKGIDRKQLDADVASLAESINKKLKISPTLDKNAINTLQEQLGNIKFDLNTDQILKSMKDVVKEIKSSFDGIKINTGGLETFTDSGKNATKTQKEAKDATNEHIERIKVLKSEIQKISEYYSALLIKIMETRDISKTQQKITTAEENITKLEKSRDKETAPQEINYYNKKIEGYQNNIAKYNKTIQETRVKEYELTQDNINALERKITLTQELNKLEQNGSTEANNKLISDLGVRYKSLSDLGNKIGKPIDTTATEANIKSLAMGLQESIIAINKVDDGNSFEQVAVEAKQATKAIKDATTATEALDVAQDKIDSNINLDDKLLGKNQIQEVKNEFEQKTGKDINQEIKLNISYDPQEFDKAKSVITEISNMVEEINKKPIKIGVTAPTSADTDKNLVADETKGLKDEEAIIEKHKSLIDEATKAEGLKLQQSQELAKVLQAEGEAFKKSGDEASKAEAKKVSDSSSVGTSKVKELTEEQKQANLTAESYSKLLAIRKDINNLELRSTKLDPISNYKELNSTFNSIGKLETEYKNLYSTISLSSEQITALQAEQKKGIEATTLAMENQADKAASTFDKNFVNDYDAQIAKEKELSHAFAQRLKTKMETDMAMESASGDYQKMLNSLNKLNPRTEGFKELKAEVRGIGDSLSRIKGIDSFDDKNIEAGLLEDKLVSVNKALDEMKVKSSNLNTFEKANSDAKQLLGTIDSMLKRNSAITGNSEYMGRITEIQNALNTSLNTSDIVTIAPQARKDWSLLTKEISGANLMTKSFGDRVSFRMLCA